MNRNQRVVELNQKCYDLCRAAIMHAQMDMAADDGTIDFAAEAVPRVMRIVAEWLGVMAEMFDLVVEIDEIDDSSKALDIMIVSLLPLLQIMQGYTKVIKPDIHGVKD